MREATYHLPGLFEAFDFYRAFLPLYREHRDWFFDWCRIGSLYGAPADCIWGGGRVGNGDADAREVLAMTNAYGISPRLTFSNSLLREEHLADRKCNALCALFQGSTPACGVILHSDLLLDYLKERYPRLCFISSTTKVLTDFSAFLSELRREDFSFVVPDFRLNHDWEHLQTLTDHEKEKTEFLCNECCDIACADRKKCYEAVSRRCLYGEDARHVCRAPHAAEGYRFSHAMQSPAFISADDIRERYLPCGFSQFKIEGRNLGSALLLEFILHYLTKPAYHLPLREALYLDSTLDLF